MRRRALLAIALALAGCGDRARLDALAAGPRAAAVDASSGDRLTLAGGQAVRLAGVEAPPPGEPYAAAARAELLRLARGRTVELLYAGPPPAAGGEARAQVRVTDGGPWLQAALLDAGAVRVRPATEERALTDVMLAHEARARRAERGLWSLAAYRVHLPDELGPYEHGLQLVEGRVARVGQGRGRVWIDFTDRWRDAASAEIPTRVLRDFRDAGLDPYALRGRLVRIRGEAERQRLTLATPEAVEVLAGR